MENIHAGHRERLKNRYREHGLDNFTDIEVLEILLFYAMPRCNTNETAHALLDRFRSFRGVMEADIQELAMVRGVGENAATLLHLVTDINRRYLLSAREEKPFIRSTEDAGRYLEPMFTYAVEESAVLLCLDGASKVIGTRRLATGMVNKVDFSAREVVSLVLRENAAGVILAHNHLSGNALPSDADKDTTAKLYAALNLIGVRLIDHIIFCEDDYVSMLDSGFFLTL